MATEFARQAAFESHLAPGQGTLRSEVRAGDGNFHHPRGSAGQRRAGHAIRARRNAADRAAPARADVSGPQRPRESRRTRPAKSDHPGSAAENIRSPPQPRSIEADLAGITQFIREKKIVSLTSRDNLKVIPTPPFERGSYSVAGFHSAPPLEPQAEAQYWVTPIDPQMPDAKAESKLREYNDFTLQWLSIHEALPGHYIQFEHLNNIQPERRRLLRSLYANGAYVEGWAEYIAQVMMDEGFLDNDPRFRMVMRKIRLRVISNAILDIKM